MFSRNIKNKSAFTLIEILVASLVFTIIGYAIFRTWSQITFNQSVVEARGQAKTDVETISRRLVRDIAMARAKSIPGDSGADDIAMTITKKSATAGGAPQEINVTYSRAGNDFSRTEGGDTNPLTSNLKEFTWARESTASGVIYLTITVEVPVRGYGEMTQIHSQESMVTVKEEAIGSGDEPRWKRSQDLLKNW